MFSPVSPKYGPTSPTQPAPNPPEFFRVRSSKATEGAVSTTFAIPGLSTIPSDSNKSQQTHKVTIAELNFSDVDLEWITVPKDTQSAFLSCKVKKHVGLPCASWPGERVLEWEFRFKIPDPARQSTGIVFLFSRRRSRYSHRIPSSVEEAKVVWSNLALPSRCEDEHHVVRASGDD